MKQVPKTCTGVKCMIVGCRNLATHKVGEENIWDENDPDEKENYYNFEASHNATTYLCDDHFKFVMTRETEYNTIEDNRFDKNDEIKPKRYVGVISWTTEDFLNWKREQGFDKINPSHVARKFSIGNTFYVCLTRPEHSCGYTFDEVIQTNNARNNKDIDKILDYCMVAIKTGGTLNI